MIPVAFTFWAIAAPAGYLAGDVFRAQNQIEDADWLPYMTAVFTPMAAVLAVVSILKSTMKETNDE